MFLNSSRIGVWNLCRRKFFWMYLFRGTGLTGGIKADYFSFGVAVHAGLDAFYAGKGTAGALEAAHDALVREKLGVMGVPLAEWKEEEEFLARLLTEYFKEGMKQDDFTVVNTERDFVVPLGEVCYACGREYGFSSFDPTAPVTACLGCSAEIHYWVGRTDLDVNRNGHLAIVDHKTTSSTPSDEFLAPFGTSFQLLGYVYGRGKSSGCNIESFGVNALQKAATVGLPQAETKACPICRAGKIKMLTCTACNATGRVEKAIKLEPFRRKFFPVVPSDIDRFVLTMHGHIRGMEHEAELFRSEPEIAYPMNDKACKFGPCPFFQHTCWGPQAATQWHCPDELQLEGFDPRPADYVDLRSILVEETV